MLVMDRWALVGDATASGPRVGIGPENDTLPTSFSATYTNTEEPLELELSCRWGGERVVVDEVVVRGRDGRPVTPRDMAAVELGRAVYLATAMFAEPAQGALNSEDRSNRRPTPDELRHLAAVYAMQFAAWGRPRQRVMEIWNLPRSTANSWIRKARELYPEMPAGEGER